MKQENQTPVEEHSKTIETKKGDDKVFAYDHPVLRKIEGKLVFYISAIMDETQLKSTPRNSKTQTGKL